VIQLDEHQAKHLARISIESTSTRACFWAALFKGFLKLAAEAHAISAIRNTTVDFIFV